MSWLEAISKNVILERGYVGEEDTHSSFCQHFIVDTYLQKIYDCVDVYNKIIVFTLVVS